MALVVAHIILEESGVNYFHIDKSQKTQFPELSRPRSESKKKYLMQADRRSQNNFGELVPLTQMSRNCMAISVLAEPLA